MSSTTTLSSAAADRKARLAQLKSLKRKQPPDSTAGEDDEEATPAQNGTAKATEEDDISSTILSGRNYDSLTKGPRLGFETDPSLTAGSATVEARAQALSEEVAAQLALEKKEAEEAAAAEQQQHLDLFKLRPKKPNWDLKRRLEERMRVVDVRTENAIARLVRERIEGRKKDGASKEEQKGEGGEGELGIEGNALVEATKEREREAEDDARRDREAEEELEAS